MGKRRESSDVRAHFETRKMAEGEAGKKEKGGKYKLKYFPQIGAL